MEITTTEIADGIYRLSTYVPEVGPHGFSFNQFLIDADEPLIFHTGMRALFPLVSEAVARVVPLAKLRWITFGHVEADECAAMNQFLAAAPKAQVAHGITGVMTSLNDLADRPPRALGDGEVLDLGTHGSRAVRVRHVDTPHVPHNWESRVLFEESTRTLFCGDLVTQDGNAVPLTTDWIVDQAILAEDIFRQTSLAPAVPQTMRRLAELQPRTLAIMHGSSFTGDGAALLNALADAYEARYEQTRSMPVPA